MGFLGALSSCFKGSPPSHKTAGPASQRVKNLPLPSQGSTQQDKGHQPVRVAADVECIVHDAVDVIPTWHHNAVASEARHSPIGPPRLPPGSAACEEGLLHPESPGLFSATCSVASMAGRFTSSLNPSTFDVLSIASNEQIAPLELTALTPARRSLQVCATPAELLRDITSMTFVSRGASSIVFQGIWQSATVAVKMLSSPTMCAQSVSVREALLGAELSHPNLVQCYTVRCLEVTDEMLQLAAHQGMSRPEQELSRTSFDSEDGFGPPPSPPAPALISWASLPSTPSAGNTGAWATNLSLSRMLRGGSTLGYSANLSAPSVGGNIMGVNPYYTGQPNVAGMSPLGPSHHSTGQVHHNSTGQVHHNSTGQVHHHSMSSMPNSRMAKSCSTMLCQDLLFSQLEIANVEDTQTTTGCRTKRSSACQLSTTSHVPTEWMLPPASAWSGEGNRWSDVLQALKITTGQVMVLVVCEWADLGMLSQVIHQEKLFLSPRDPQRDLRKLAVRALLRTVREIALGLNHLHEAGVIHADIKPGNVVLSSSRVDRRGFVAKLTDLGLSRVISNVTQDASGHLCSTQDDACIENAEWGTTVYMAPEHLNGKLCKASDMYSMGVVIWEMVHACRPFAGYDRADVVDAVRGGTASLIWEPERVPAALINLAQACLSYCPQARPTCREFITELIAIETMVRDELPRNMRGSLELQTLYEPTLQESCAE